MECGDGGFVAPPVIHSAAELGRGELIFEVGKVRFMGLILLVILILLLVGGLPTWGHSRNWGYAPSGGVGLLLLVLIILMLMGRI
jgi:hypothetical protein